MRVESQRLAPQRQVLRRGDVRPDVGGEQDDLAERALDAKQLLGRLIRKQERQRQDQGADAAAQSDPIQVRTLRRVPSVHMRWTTNSGTNGAK